MRSSEAYEILGVPPGSPIETVKEAYRRRALEAHPDKRGGDHEEFVRVRAAYEIICEFLRSAAGDLDVPLPRELREVVDGIVEDFRRQFENAEALCASRFQEFGSRVRAKVARCSRGGLKRFGEEFRLEWNAFVRDLFLHFNESCDRAARKYEDWFRGSTATAFRDVNINRFRRAVRSITFYTYAYALLAAGVLWAIVVRGYGPRELLHNPLSVAWPVVFTPALYAIDCLVRWERPKRSERLDLVLFSLDEGTEFEGSAALKESSRRARNAGWGGAGLGAAFGSGGDPILGAVIGLTVGAIVERFVHPTEKIRQSILRQLDQFLAVAEPELARYVSDAHRTLLEEVKDRVVGSYSTRVNKLALLRAGV